MSRSSSSPTPVLALRGSVILPGGHRRLRLADEEDVAVLNAAAQRGELIAIPFGDVQHRSGEREVSGVGTLCRLIESVELTDGTREVLLLGRRRVRVARLRWSQDGTAWTDPRAVRPRAGDPAELQRAADRCLERARALLRADPRAPRDLVQRAMGWSPVLLPDRLAEELDLPTSAGRRLLAETNPLKRLAVLEKVLATERARARERVIGRRTSSDAGRGPADPRAQEVARFEHRIESRTMPEDARRQAWRELAHFRLATPGSAEASRLRSYIEWLLDLPWNRVSPDPPNSPESFERVASVLDQSHVGLTDVKNRVVEFLAVRQLGGGSRGGALCFRGPPGTGKSSMARAVAQALGREFVRVSLGSLTDEAELRGYSHAVADAVPGALLQGIHRAGTRNPVVLLDEIDKVQLGSSGDTGGVLLEVLDPERSGEFLDSYLGVSFDLSQCLFLATANDTDDMPEALVDRLEVIEFHSFTEPEKLAIARAHLLPRARENAGLEPAQLRISPAAMVDLVRRYTEEAGVRQFQRALDALARKAAMNAVRLGGGLSVRKSDLFDLLGPTIVDEELSLRHPRIGFALGLAWTSVGGSLLPIEALAMPGSGRTILTGSLGEVLRESVQTALSYVRCSFGDFGVRSDLLDELDLHLHFPSGATPKDGPSAGVGIATSLVSLVTGTQVRHDVAMTGEVSLHGAVLPVGGLREKVLAAQRAGIHTVIVPARNAEELMRLPADVRRDVELVLVDHIRQVFAAALVLNRRTRMGKVFAEAVRGRSAACGPEESVRKGPAARKRGRRRSG